MKLIDWVMVYALWKVVSEQGVKTRSREGVGVTDAGKVGSAANCYAFSVLPFR